MQRAAERWRWEDTSHSPKDRRGKESSWAGLWLRFSQRTLMKLKKYLESLETLTPSLLPLPQQKPDAFCFECLVATSPYLITLSLQLLTCLYLPQAATSHLPLPKLPFPPPSPIPPTASSCVDEVCGLYRLFFKRFTIAFSGIFFFSFLPHSFNRILLVMPIPIFLQTLHLTLAQTPCRPCCSEHCGVLRTAWSNVDEARGSPLRGVGGVYTLNTCQMSLKVHNGSVLLTCEYDSMLFISCL